MREVASFGAAYGIKVRLEVHGYETCYPPYIKQMVNIANYSNLYVCWNSNMQDIDETGLTEKTLMVSVLLKLDRKVANQKSSFLTIEFFLMHTTE
ncbi:hypothetical protein J7K25_05610 [bacterium]|nr:hypothetical protein [bacterium]